MSIVAADLVLYGTADNPSTDSTASGGAIDTQVRPVFTQLTATAVIAIISDGADTRDVQIIGRDAAGVVQTETLTLNGNVEVVGVQAFERLHSVAANGTDAARTVTVRQGSGGATRGSIPVNEVGFYCLFRNSASDTGAVTRFEKVHFVNNTGGGLTLTNPTITLSADPAARIRIAKALAINDNVSLANRKTAPGGVAWVDDGIPITIPDLAPGDSQGVWVAEELLAGDNPMRSSFTLVLSGTTA